MQRDGSTYRRLGFCDHGRFGSYSMHDGYGDEADP